MNVEISNRQKDLPIAEKNIQQIVSEVIAFEGQQAAEVSLNFVDTAEICRLHEKHFDDPSPTDCISFPIDGPEETHYRVLGEIYICPQAAIEQGDNPYVETTLYLVHGLLHLMGYKDRTKQDITTIRSAEKRHMDHLQSLNLILESSKN